MLKNSKPIEEYSQKQKNVVGKNVKENGQRTSAYKCISLLIHS